MENTLIKTEQINYDYSCKRIRIYLKPLYKNKTLCSQLSNYMLTVSGVQFSKANELTGKILIFYNEDITDEYNIGCQIYSFVKKNFHPSKNSKIIDIDSFKEKQNYEPAIKPVYLNNVNAPNNNNSDNKFPFYTMTKKQIETILKTNSETGLSNSNVSKILKQKGYNVLSEKKRKSILSKIMSNLFSTKLLLGVGTISLLLGQIYDGIAILGIVALETILSTIQQHKAENSISSLKGIMVNKSRVIRDGKEKVIHSKNLVPGDIILVESGDKVPADARIIESYELRTTEASLTGESTPISKNSKKCKKNISLADQSNMIFMGTDIVSGRAKAIVTATGMDTEIGKIAFMLQNIQQDLPPIQKKVNKLTKLITFGASGLCLLFIIGGLMAGISFGQVLVMAICFSIGAIPESLPAVVSASMAMSVQRMAKKNAIVRSLPAVETLGSTDVICCDKTGTLTMNEMTVKQMYTDNSYYDVSGSGYSPEGNISLSKGSFDSTRVLEKMLKVGVLCNNATLFDKNGSWVIQGDPTEGAILTVAEKHGISVPKTQSNYIRVKEIPFDSSRQYMVTLHKGENELIACCKGAFSKVIEKCSSIYENGQERLLTSTEKENLQNVCENMGDQALRVLSFAYKKLQNEKTDIESNYVFLGFVGMEDPPKPNVKESIKKCHYAGINVVMITGDNKNTASQIAKQLGLLTDGIIITGSDLDAMDDIELQSKIDKIQVFARTCPEQKHRIVKALKSVGHTVAMIGDGVNDTPAMKEADIGVAMGKNGSDVAKDVADITLVDDNFSTIVEAIQEGRSVTNNIQNAIKYLLAGALGEVAAISLCTLGFGTLPLLSIQILWVNVIAETIIGSALAIEPPCYDVMNRKPYHKGESLLNQNLMHQIVKNGLLIGLSTLGIFSGAMFMGLGLPKARTLAFTTLIFSQLVFAYRCRSNLKEKPSKYMHAAFISSTALLISVLYYPPLSSFFGTVPLNMANAGSVFLASNINQIGALMQ